MKTSVIKTATYFFLITPFILILALWKILPDQVVVHYSLFGHKNIQDKWWIVFIAAVLTVGAYGILRLAEKWARRYKPDSDVFPNYLLFRLILLSVLSMYSCLIVIQSTDLINTPVNLAHILSGCIVLVLGFIFPLLPPNYLIGVRTKWTLSDKDVWKKTHHFSRYVWVLAGSMMMALSLVYSIGEVNIFYFIIIFLASGIPVGYSYLIYRSVKNRSR